MKLKERYKLIPIDNIQEWNNAIKSCGIYDTYHLAEYHKLAQMQGEGEPWLFNYSLGNYNAVLPFLRRPLSEINGLEDFYQYDCTSVYGYPGALSSINSKDPNADEFKFRFQRALKQVLRELSVVAFFTRQNPLINTSWLFSGCAEIVSLSLTVAINLKLHEDEQMKGMTKGHRYDIRKASRQGVIAREVPFFEYLDIFISIYNETMARTGAHYYYIFSKEYYTQLKESLGNSVKLYIAELKDKIIAASIFLLSEKIVQYHLSGARSEYFSFSGTKVIINEVRKWAKARGFSWLHLGGGVGSKEDTLFRFKAGFSKYRPQFNIIKWIIDPVIYRKAVNRKKSSNVSFFPAYRSSLSSLENS